MGKGPDLKRYMDKNLSLTLNGGRIVKGVLRGYDQFMNLVLEEAKGNTINRATRVRALASSRLFSSSNAAQSKREVKLPDLTYDYGALEPHISGEIMEIHHKKHHQAYVTNFNASLGKLVDAEQKGDITSIVQLQAAIKFNGGGHVNHTIFWKNLCPVSAGGGVLNDGPLKSAIMEQFGSLDDLKTKLSAASVGVQGSGWGWLAYDKTANGLAIVTCANQDPLEGTTGLIPLLGIDVWEHAYYLQYKNVRPDYVKSIFNVVNWKNVEERYTAIKK